MLKTPNVLELFMEISTQVTVSTKERVTTFQFTIQIKLKEDYTNGIYPKLFSELLCSNKQECLFQVLQCHKLTDNSLKIT